MVFTKFSFFNIIENGCLLQLYKLKIYEFYFKLIVKLLLLPTIITLKRSSNKESSAKRSVNELVKASSGVYSGQLVCIRSSNLCSKGWGVCIRQIVHWGL